LPKELVGPVGVNKGDIAHTRGAATAAAIENERMYVIAWKRIIEGYKLEIDGGMGGESGSVAQGKASWG
jgi:hypothetical protein